MLYKAFGLGILLLAMLGISLSGVKMEKRNPDSRINIYDATTAKVVSVPRIERTDEEWMLLLSPEQYRVTRQKGTETPFTGACSLPPEGQSGIYQCVACGTDLFKYDAKFESGTGWPSFWDPVSELNVKQVADHSYGMNRTEVLCARCGAHLGHVFDDGPPPSGKRYCMNAAAMKLAVGPKETQPQIATFAAGCFWGTEATFRKFLGKGVISTRVGYTGGHVDHPTYEQVCGHTTGHREAVEVTFDPALISYEQLLNVFWHSHNPRRSDGQGPDVGPQYRAAIFYHSPEQKRLAEESKLAVEKEQHLEGKVATEILLASTFWPAEAYHQQYYEKNGISGGCPVY
jgi:peptide methionine sulfoxide reductase msrA/msrB